MKPNKLSIVALAEELTDEANAAFDLWTWLPSYSAAKACHGDQWCEFCPSNADIMREAATYFAILSGSASNEYKTEFECPCGECEGPDSCIYCELSTEEFRCRIIEELGF